jgi:hypothetical protein
MGMVNHTLSVGFFATSIKRPLMGIELVYDENPDTFGVHSDGLLNMGHEISFLAAVAQRRGHTLPGGDFQVGNQGLSAMANVLMFPQPNLSWLHRLVRIRSLQRLDAGLLIAAHQMDTGLMQLGGCSIQFTHLLHFLIKLLWIFPPFVIQPVAAAMGLQLRLVLKNAPPDWRRCG